MGSKQEHTGARIRCAALNVEIRARKHTKCSSSGTAAEYGRTHSWSVKIKLALSVVFFWIKRGVSRLMDISVVYYILLLLY